MNTTLHEVSTRKQLRDFIRFPDTLYKDCLYYVPALHQNQLSTLSTDKNPAFGHCEAKYWLAYKDGKIAGRVAGIINHRYNQEQGGRYMRFGWMDFIEDQEVVHALFRAVENWARQHNMQFIHGPLGFTSFDASGVLIEGFEEWPTTFGKYNDPYYDPLIRQQGYEKDADWVEYRIRTPEQMPQRIVNLAELVAKRYDLRHAVFNNRRELKKHTEAIFDLVNTVYRGIYGFSTLTPEQIMALSDDFIKLVDPDFVSVILDRDDRVVGFGVAIHSLVKALKKAKGSLLPLGWFHLMSALRSNDTIDLLLIGVREEYQNRGVNAMIFDKITRTIYRKGVRHIETTRELEDNKKVQQLWTGYEARQHKRARCYIKALQEIS